MQLEAIASHPIVGYLGEDINTCLTTTAFQAVVESDKVSPQEPSNSLVKLSVPHLVVLRKTN